MKPPRSYEAERVIVRFEARRCIHAEECVRNLPGVFNLDRRPWITPEGASVEDVVSVIERCPSGALTYERTDGGPSEAVGADPTIVAVRDGPLYLRGRVELRDHLGDTIPVGPRAALCRCGGSKNKPYCDNSHRDIGFSDASPPRA